MAEFYNIPKAEMEEFLQEQGFMEVLIPGTIELVYGKRISQDDLQLTLRVYTGIGPGGHSRDKGKDAIRVGLYLRTKDGQRIVRLGGSKRVHRVKGWKENLQKRLDTWEMPKHACEKCRMPMIPRKGKNGLFLGCSGYPDCKNNLY